MTTPIETFRRLRGYQPAISTPVTHPVNDDRAAKSGAMKLTMPKGVDPGVWQRTYDAVLEDTGDEMKAYLAALGQVRRGRYGMATKARKDGVRAYCEGWGILFGDPKLTDTDEQYFARDTQFLLDYFGVGMPLWWEHGDDPAYGSIPIGRRVSWQVYDYGIWFVHELDMDHPLILRTLKALDDGEMSYSSDSIYHYVARGLKPDGKLSNWGLCGFSLVHRPAELGLGVTIPRIEDVETEGELPETMV